MAEKFYREINQPVVTNIELEWLGEGAAPEIYPQKSPDLFASQPLVLYGRKEDAKSGQLKITGTIAGGKLYEKILNVNFQQVGGNNAIAQLWGRSRIGDLMNQMYGQENSPGVEAVTKTALDYNLLSKYTAFVAVDDKLQFKNSSADAFNSISDRALSSSLQPESLSNNPTNNSQSNSQSVPEPSEIIGNLLALMLVVLFFTRKRWQHLFKCF